MSHFQVTLLSLHTGNTLVNLHQIVTFNQFRHQSHQLVVGVFTLTNARSLVICQVMQLLNDTLHLGMVSLLVLCVSLLVGGCCIFSIITDHIRVLLYLFDILPILAVTLICQKQLLA